MTETTFTGLVERKFTEEELENIRYVMVMAKPPTTEYKFTKIVKKRRWWFDKVTYEVVTTYDLGKYEDLFDYDHNSFKYSAYFNDPKEQWYTFCVKDNVYKATRYSSGYEPNQYYEALRDILKLTENSDNCYLSTTHLTALDIIKDKVYE